MHTSTLRQTTLTDELFLLPHDRLKFEVSPPHNSTPYHKHYIQGSNKNNNKISCLILGNAQPNYAQVQ